MHNILAFLPEFFFFFCILFFVLHGVEFSISGRSKHFLNSVYYSVLISFCTMLLLFFNIYTFDNTVVDTFYNNVLLRDAYSFYVELLILFISILIFLSSSNYNKDNGIFSFEFYLLMLFCILSFCFFLHVNNLVFLFILMELQSISSYILTSYNTKQRHSIEAGLKYFILGSFSSILLLFGFSLIFGFTGLSFFDELSLFVKYIYSVEDDFFIFIFFFSIVCFLIGFLFKLYVAPFHFWISDIYQGSPSSVTFFFSTVPVISYLYVFLKLYTHIWLDFFFFYQWLFYVFSILSMFFGAFGALVQKKIKKLLAYSSVSGIGYILMGISCNSLYIFHHSLHFFFVYIFNLIPVFFFLLNFRINSFFYIDNISSFSSIYVQNKFLLFVFCSFFFSIAGIPPFSGFVTKLLLYQSLVLEYHYFFSFFFLISALISSFYYLRIIKLVFYESDSSILWFNVRPFPTVVLFFYFLFFFFHLTYFFSMFFFSDLCFLLVFDFFFSI